MEVQWDYQREWEKIGQEYQAAAKAAESSHGIAVAWIGDTLEQMRDRESERADRVIRAALNEFRGTGFMDAAMVRQITGFTGRVYGPRTLWVLDMGECLADDAYASVVPYVWGLAEYPGLAMSRKDWRRFWGKAGFVIDGEPAQRPDAPIQLWRGASRGHKGGMSWTDDQGRAEWFVKARQYPHGAFLWTALVPPGNLLGAIHESGRGESEWIVDTRRVTILQVE